MNCRELITFLETEVPLEAAEGWDNPGVLVGDKDKEIKKVLIVLDKFINLVKNLNNAVCKGTKDDAEKFKAYFNTVVKFKAEQFGGIWKEFYSLRDKAR